MRTATDSETMNRTRALILFLLLCLATVTATGERHRRLAGGRTAKQQEAKMAAERLRRWLRDPTASRELLDTWRGHSSPLAAAFAALNASTSTFPSGDEDPRLSYVSFGCLLDVFKLLTANELWALSMMDASVKTPVGLLEGVMRHLGNWDECVDQRGIPSLLFDRTFNGQMCQIRLVAEDAWEDSDSSAGDSHSLALGKRRMISDPIIVDFLYYSEISLSVCVPDSCSAWEVENIFSALLGQLKIVEGVRLQAAVYDGDCTTRDAPEMESGDVVAVVVLSVLAALVLLSTVYDATTPEEERRDLPAAFSVISNGRRLLELPRATADHSLSCLHGMRFLSMCWVVLCHRYPTPLIVPSVNPSFIQYVYGDFFHIFLMNGYIAVDTFFVLSGLLLAYLFFKQDASKQHLNIPLYYLHRFIRLTPALAMIVLLEATLIYHVGWGPLWEEVLGGDREICKKNWWKTILYVANYIKPFEPCVEQAWYLMVDMQLHLLSPLVLLPLAYVPKFGIAWLSLLSVGGTVSNFLIRYLEDTTGEGNHSAYVEYSLKNVLGFTHTRFVPYLIGIAAGYLLAIRRRSGEKKPFPFVISNVGWVVAAGLMLGGLLGYNIYLGPPYPTQLESSLYESLERPAWALGLVLMVFLCASGNGGGANVFLSWWGFHILGRLTYSMYLVHLRVQAVQRGSTKTAIYAKDAEILVMFCGDLVISLVFGAMLYLVCESPFVVLEKELLGGGGKKKRRGPNEVSAVPATIAVAPLPSAPEAAIDLSGGGDGMETSPTTPVELHDAPVNERGSKLDENSLIDTTDAPQSSSAPSPFDNQQPNSEDIAKSTDDNS